MTDRINSCLVCGKEIVYTEKADEKKCVFCNGLFISNSVCEEGHFVCDKCHGKGAMPVIKAICYEASSTSPREIALKIMASPTVHMHGPEHHTIVGAALLTAYKNAGGNVSLNDALQIIMERGAKVPGGICGNWGCCGAAVGAGIFLSAATKSNPLNIDRWGLCNLLTSECLKAIGSVGGPRCCKRDSAIAINTAVDFVSNNLGITMEKDTSICEFANRNKECIEDRCPFFGSTTNTDS